MYWSTAPGGTQQPEQAEQELEQERAGRRLKRQESGAGGGGWGVHRKQPDHIRQRVQFTGREEEKRTDLVGVVPRMRLLIPSRLTNTLSMSSLPVKSSAITYKLGLTALAASSMA